MNNDPVAMYVPDFNVNLLVKQSAGKSQCMNYFMHKYSID